MAKSIIITGCDTAFFPFMDEALRSLFALHLNEKAAIGILDLGLTPDQLQALKAQGCIICKPTWTLTVPEEIRSDKMLGLVARTALRDYFPGFEIYLWFDADAWAQTSEFFEMLVAGAIAKDAAVVRENGSGYRRSLRYHRWWYGHMLTAYGLPGLKVAFKPAVNIGILALSATAPHWKVWQRYYQQLIATKQKLNLDQHAFNAAIELEHLPYAQVSARCNWICTMSTPLWDKERKLFCASDDAASPLSVLHLAGPDKCRTYRVRRISGEIISTPLTYSAFQALQ